MELLQLKYFCDAAQSENFSATAKKFFVPPSAISQSIQRLERELGSRLFERQANRIRLNEKGKGFYKRVREALTLLEDAKTQVKDDGSGGKLRLSIFINRRIVMQTVEAFSRCYPQVEVITKYNVSPDVEEMDLVISDIAPGGGELLRQELMREDILLAVRREHPLAQRSCITAADLEQAPFICTNQGSSLYRIAQEICGDLGFSPHIVICSDDPYYIRKCIELGLGVSLIPARSWQGEFSDRIVLRSVGDYRRTTYVYRNKRTYTSSCVQHFLQMLQEEFHREGIERE